MSLKMGRLAVLPAAVFAWASVAVAHGADEAGTGDKPTAGATATSIPGGDTGVKGTGQGEEQEKKKLPWHGTTFMFDQSVTTQTIGVGGDYQSYDPVYEQWYSFRPKYYLYESDLESVDVNLRLDMYLELTNSDTTTYRNEPSFGDPWINLVYGRYLYRDKDTGYATKASIGARVLPGISKTSRGRGTVASAGATMGLSQLLPINGPNAEVFPTVGFNGGLVYLKGLDRCTTPCNTGFTYVRQDTDARSFESDQLAGTPLISHTLMASLGSELAITQKFKFSAMYIWVMQWAYTVDQQPATVNTLTGPVTAAAVSQPTNFHVSPWLLLYFDYEVFDEMALTLGYYNYTSQIGPNGERRSPVWSPDARFFFSATFALDEIYLRIAGEKNQKNHAKNARRAAVTASSAGPALQF